MTQLAKFHKWPCPCALRECTNYFTPLSIDFFGFKLMTSKLSFFKIIINLIGLSFPSWHERRKYQQFLKCWTKPTFENFIIPLLWPCQRLKLLLFELLIIRFRVKKKLLKLNQRNKKDSDNKTNNRWIKNKSFSHLPSCAIYFRWHWKNSFPKKKKNKRNPKPRAFS